MTLEEIDFRKHLVTPDNFSDLEAEICGATFCRDKLLVGDRVIYKRGTWFHEPCANYMSKNGSLIKTMDLSNLKRIIEKTREKNLRKLDMREKISRTTAPQEEPPNNEDLTYGENFTLSQLKAGGRPNASQEPLWKQHQEHYSKKTTRFRTYIITEGKLRYVKDFTCGHCNKEFEVGQRIIIWGVRSPYNRLHEECYEEWWKQRPSKRLISRAKPRTEKPPEISQPETHTSQDNKTNNHLEMLDFCWFMWRLGITQPDLKTWIQERKILET